MTTVKDRKQIGQLMNPPPNHRNASNSVWTQPPTPIALPSNNRLITRNPYNNLGDRKDLPNTTVGNPTSRRTILARPSGQDGPPPVKKRRLENPVKVVDERRRGTTANGDLHRPLLGPQDAEVINVDDDIEGEHPGNHGRTRRTRQSSDELNITSHPSTSTGQVSKFSFGQLGIQGKARRTPPLAPDGPETEWLDEKYGNMDSDPIENFSEIEPPFTRGKVKRVIEEIEANGRTHPKATIQERNDKGDKKSRRIDLSQVQKTKKAVNMKGRKSSAKTGVTTFTSFNGAKDLDPVASSTSLVRKEPTEHGPLPVKETYLDAHFYPESGRQKLEVFWTSDHKFIMRANESQVFRLLLTPENCKRITYSTYNGERAPVIQLLTEEITGHGLVTIKFAANSPAWGSKMYDKMLKSFHSGLKREVVAHGDTLWEIAMQDGSVGTSGKSTQLNEVGHSRMHELGVIQSRKNHDLQPAPRNKKRKASFDHTHSGSPSTDASRTKNENSEQQKSQPTVTTRRSTNQEAGPSNLRRSTRNTAVAKVVPPADLDEVILVYPQGTPGAVNITNADLRRLEPGEFLNDTLIEFGLKLWLKDLEQTNPELASQIHVFNSFFYKKLNHKDPQQAYESVRKWTSKFDIFQKKYIIVPINEHLHWYLAIIYEPEHVLYPNVSEAPVPRKQTRSSAKTAATDPKPPGEMTSLFDDKDDYNVTTSEAEVERNLNDDFQNSCTIENTDDDLLLRPATVDDDDGNSSAALSYVSEEGDKPTTSKFRLESPTAPHAEPFTRNKGPCSVSSNEIVVDSTEEVEPPKKPNDSTAVDSASFYQPRPKNRKGKEKATVDPDIHMVDERDRDEPIIVLDESPRTYIFTMDSLGTRHPQAIKKLANYLKLEAIDKKGVQDASSAPGKFASVPVQPNFCDCGVYLLHFAQTFMTDPTQYCKGILAQKPKAMNNKERQDAWHDYKIADMRENLANRIQNLSIEWKKGRAANGEAKKIEELDGNSDVEMGSDVEVVEQTQVKKPGTVKKPVFTKVSDTKANRMRGN